MEPLLGNIFGFGNPVELGIIAAVVVLLFGGSKLANFGKSAGEGLKEFKKAINSDDVQPTTKNAVAEPPPVTVVETPAEPVSTTKE